MLAAALAAAGADIELLPRVADDEPAHREALERGLAADVLVTSGGVSVGPHDLVRRSRPSSASRRSSGASRSSRASRSSFGVRGATLVFGLPGNPVSSLVGCELFVKPALRALQGLADPAAARSSRRGSRRRRAGTPRRDEFVRARSAWTGTASCSSRSPARSRT